MKKGETKKKRGHTRSRIVQSVGTKRSVKQNNRKSGPITKRKELNQYLNGKKEKIEIPKAVEHSIEVELNPERRENPPACLFSLYFYLYVIAKQIIHSNKTSVEGNVDHSTPYSVCTPQQTQKRFPEIPTPK
jgi:hypothetical protein